MDGVDITADGGIAAAEISGQLPRADRLGPDPDVRERGFVPPCLPGPDRLVRMSGVLGTRPADSTGEVAADALPDQLPGRVRLGVQLQGHALWAWQVGCPGREGEVLGHTHATVLGHPARHVHQADGGQREARVGEQLQLQREGEHLQVAGGQVTGEGVLPARDAVTILGNLIDNAIDVLSATSISTNGRSSSMSPPTMTR